MSQAIGKFFQLLAISVFSYSTLQMFVEPLVKKNSAFNPIFLPRAFFDVAPIIAAGLAVAGASAYLYVKTLAQKKKV